MAREFIPQSMIGDRHVGWAVTFLIVALIAAVLGFGGIAGVAVKTAKIVFFVAVILLAIAAFSTGARAHADLP